MKILCKRSITNSISILKKGTCYEIKENFTNGCSIIPGKHADSFYMSKEYFNKYFYNVEETQNILRTKLIERMIG